MLLFDALRSMPAARTCAPGGLDLSMGTSVPSSFSDLHMLTIPITGFTPYFLNLGM